jgi:hypothetical protein
VRDRIELEDTEEERTMSQNGITLMFYPCYSMFSDVPQIAKFTSPRMCFRVCFVCRNEQAI